MNDLQVFSTRWGMRNAQTVHNAEIETSASKACSGGKLSKTDRSCYPKRGAPRDKHCLQMHESPTNCSQLPPQRAVSNSQARLNRATCPDDRGPSKKQNIHP